MDRKRPIEAADSRLETAEEPVSVVVYRSHATRPFTPSGLTQLVRSAKANNKAASLTGFILYDDHRFLQWLEGPDAALQGVIRKIENDPRHDDMEFLTQHKAKTRLFADWGLMVSSTMRRDFPDLAKGVEPDSALIDSLHHHPYDAPLLLQIRGRQWRRDQRYVRPRNITRTRSLNKTTMRPHLKEVLRQKVVPHLLQRRVQNTTHDLGLIAGPFARLLIDGERNDIHKFIVRTTGPDHNQFSSVTRLFEAAEKKLGDLWRTEQCTEFDIVIAQTRMIAALRQLFGFDAPLNYTTQQTPAVLVATQPGEPHMLRAVLDAETLWRAGWAPERAFPASDEALERILSDHWVDVLDLSSSGVFRRDHWLPRMTETVAHARDASMNPALAVIVGGRIFTEDHVASADIGADGDATSANVIENRLLDLVNPLGKSGARQKTDAPQELDTLRQNARKQRKLQNS